jgi:hypothetical protein
LIPVVVDSGFIAYQSTAALSHRKPASPLIPHDMCSAQVRGKIYAQFTFVLQILIFEDSFLQGKIFQIVINPILRA